VCPCGDSSGGGLPACRGATERQVADLYEPLLGDTEREAVSNLLQYLESMRARPAQTHAHTHTHSGNGVGRC
jgi:hypothetical protein